jgi:gamma-polyglutamate biosynthesis protein CapA
MEKVHVHIKAVGDIATGDYTISGLGILGVSKKIGCDNLFTNISGVMKDCDLLLGNLEGSLSESCRITDMRLCGLPEMAYSLKRIGFDVLSVANNHVLDHGPLVFMETVFHCKQAGLLLAGLRGNSDFYSEPVIIDKNGLKFGILAYNWIGLDKNNQAGDYIAAVYDGVVNYTWNRDKDSDLAARQTIQFKNQKVIEDIKNLRMLVDIIILMPHWGYEWSFYPPYGITTEAKSFIDAGADLILGAHPHVPQGIEIYKNKLIVYSMGNFLFDSTTEKFKYGMMVEYKIIDSTHMHNLIFIDRGDKFRPCIASKEASTRNMEIVNESSARITSLNSQQLLDDDLIYLEFERQYKALKISKILYLLKNIPRHPFIIAPIIKKILNLLKLAALRITGKKIRW